MGYRNKKEKQLEDSITAAVGNSMSDDELYSFAEYNDENAEKVNFSNYSYWRSTFQTFCKNKVAVFLVFVVVAILVFTFIQPYLPGQYDPNKVNNDPKTFIAYRNIAPNSQFWFGTNSIGQDLWARTWAAVRTSLTIGISVALVETVVGILMGVLWGYVRQLDFILTEIYNVLDNLPNTLVLILISYVMKQGMSTMIFAMCLTGWIQMARFIRNQIIIIRDRDYNMASRCVGTPTIKIIFKNLLPYLVSVIMLRIALSVPSAIGNEVFITFIGLGLPLEVPSLGRLVVDGRSLMMSPDLRYQLVIPTVFLSIITISFYVVGNAFSDAADPKNHI